MITLNANTDNEVIFFLEPYPYYLFIYTQRNGCLEISEVMVNDSNCTDYQLFNVNVDLNSGIYNLAIYGQDDYSNLNPDNSEFIREFKVKVINLCDYCGDLLLTTPNGQFIITPDGSYIEIELNC